MLYWARCELVVGLGLLSVLRIWEWPPIQSCSAMSLFCCPPVFYQRSFAIVSLETVDRTMLIILESKVPQRAKLCLEHLKLAGPIQNLQM